MYAACEGLMGRAREGRGIWDEAYSSETVSSSLHRHLIPPGPDCTCYDEGRMDESKHTDEVEMAFSPDPPINLDQTRMRR